MKKPQFSERESKSNSNAEDILRQLGKKTNPKDSMLYKAKKQLEKNPLNIKDCPSPQEFLKKSKKNCNYLFYIILRYNRKFPEKKETKRDSNVYRNPRI
jgi:hypothetical protein